MPVHAREKKESNHNDMEVDYPENEGSTTEEEDTDSSSGSEEGDSSGNDDIVLSYLHPIEGTAGGVLPSSGDGVLCTPPDSSLCPM